MKAWVLEQPGTPSSLTLAEVPLPQPGPGEVRVRVHAVGLNPVDFKLAARGHPAWHYPFILGLDVAGIVDAVGTDVSSAAVGTPFFFHGDLRRPGGLAEATVTVAHSISRIPPGLSFTDAAALPCAGFTAYQAIHRRLKVQAGQSVLVHAGAGGVGGFAVQLAAHVNARVIATCQPHHAAYVKSLGALETIDYRSEDVEERVKAFTQGRGVDAIIDTISSASATQGITHLMAFGGQMACIAGLPDLGALPWGRCISFHEIALGAAYLVGDRQAQEDLSRIGDELAALVAAGTIRSTVNQVVPFAEAPAALERLSQGGNRGKTVVRFDA